MGKSIVIKTIEERLSPYGFKYVKYQNFRWQFRREEEGGWQEIVIQKDIWGGKSYRTEIRSSVHPGVLRLSDLSDELRYCSDVLEYGNEEEQKAILHEICDVVIEHGLKKINQKAPLPEKHEVTSEMNMKLYEENAQMTQNFLERNHLHGWNRQEIFRAMKNEMEEIYNKPYEQIQGRLMEFAAVCGNMILEVIGGSWNCKGIERDPFFHQYPILKMVITSWEKQKIEILIRLFVAFVRKCRNWIVDCVRKIGTIPPTMDEWSESDALRIMKDPFEEMAAFRELELQLFEKHEEFIKDGKTLLGIESKDDITALQMLMKKIRELQDKPLENIMQELLLISAVYGNIYSKIANGEWGFSNNKGCIIHDGINFDLEPLSLIISAWIDDDAKQLIQSYNYGQIRVMRQASRQN